VIGIPVAERHEGYLLDFAQRLRRAGIRVEVDTSDERMQKKIRNAQLQKAPFMALVGDRDVEEGAVSFRLRNGEQQNSIPLDTAVERLVEAVETRAQV
jgi:threonyl-tRNA synthetase